MDRFDQNVSGPARRCILALIAVCLLGAVGCVQRTAGLPRDRGPIFFPLPPVRPRIQFLGSVSSPADLPRPRHRFADFILGSAPLRYPLVKPIKAVISGTKLYVCDTILNSVLVYDLITGEAGLLPGDRANGKIQQPNNIVVDEMGRLYVADKERGAVLIYDADGYFVHAWGRPGQVEPVAIAIAPETLYVCDMLDHEIEVWDRRDGSFLRSIGGKGTAPGRFYLPTQIAIDPRGNLVVTDTGNFRVQVLSPSGESIRQIGAMGTSLGQFAWPKGLDIDGHGRIYVADSRFANVQIFDEAGRLLLFFGGPGPDRGNLDLPAGVSVHPWLSAPWFEKRLADGFDPEYIVIVVSQKGQGFVNFFAVAREEGAEAP